jgi:hypothetical protein
LKLQQSRPETQAGLQRTSAGNNISKIVRQVQRKTFILPKKPASDKRQSSPYSVHLAAAAVFLRLAGWIGVSTHISA